MTPDLTAQLADLTLEEKASLTSGADFWTTKPVTRLGIPAVMLTDGPHGLRKQATDGEHLDIYNAVPATCFPTAATLASSWDRDLLRQIGEALGAEARAADVAVLLGPGVNIKRSPLCGRNFEYFSEDPLLAGELAAAYVHGVQSRGVAASLKHFAANNQETDRLRVSAEIDQRTLREIYLAAFERVVRQARPQTIMCAYNRINGIHASQHRELLTSILREEWGFDGLVMSDWGAVNDRVAALEAGLDLEMPGVAGHATDAEITDAIRVGNLDEKTLDQTVTRLLALLQHTSAARRDPVAADHDAHHALARRAAADGAVLLTNNGILPLNPAPGQMIAVIGEFARTPRYQGAGSSKVTPTRLDDALTALKAAVPGNVAVEFAPGFTLAGDESPDGKEEELARHGVSLAKRADTVILFLGLPDSAESEGFDRTHIDLPARQLALLDRLTAAQVRPIVVLSNGSVVATASWSSRAAAILECWLGGQASGTAVADLLLGHVNPSGRLAETIPLRLEDTPAYLNWPGEQGQVRYGEGVFVGYRYYDTIQRDVAFAFGHGLSYTTFGYSDLQITTRPDGSLLVDVTVTNTGPRPGKEVVQVYARHVAASVARPERELAGFTKVHLYPGQSRRVSVPVSPRDLAFWSTRDRRWVLEGGSYVIATGASSRDLRLQARIELDGDQPANHPTLTSTIAEWLEDRVGGPLLRAALQQSGSAGQALLTPDLAPLVHAMPVTKIPAFGWGLTTTQLQDLLRQVSYSLSHPS
jgi:beta-glucosidase